MSIVSLLNWIFFAHFVWEKIKYQIENNEQIQGITSSVYTKSAVLRIGTNQTHPKCRSDTIFVHRFKMSQREFHKKLADTIANSVRARGIFLGFSTSGKNSQKYPVISGMSSWQSQLCVTDKVWCHFENEDGPKFEISHWGKKYSCSFTAWTSKRVHWDKCPIIQYIKEYHKRWSGIESSFQLVLADKNSRYCRNSHTFCATKTVSLFT